MSAEAGIAISRARLLNLVARRRGIFVSDFSKMVARRRISLGMWRNGGRRSGGRAWGRGNPGRRIPRAGVGAPGRDYPAFRGCLRSRAASDGAIGGVGSRSLPAGEITTGPRPELPGRSRVIVSREKPGGGLSALSREAVHRGSRSVTKWLPPTSICELAYSSGGDPRPRHEVVRTSQAKRRSPEREPTRRDSERSRQAGNASVAAAPAFGAPASGRIGNNYIDG